MRRRRNKTIRLTALGSGPGGGAIALVGSSPESVPYLNVYNASGEFVGSLDGYALKELMAQIASRIGYEVTTGEGTS